MNISEEVKQRLDIASVVSGYVQLGKSGKNLRGLCPFHTEKTPSFFVFPDRQTWRCFGCGVGGDVISFVMKKEGLEFGEALKTLAQRAGVSLPEKKARVEVDERLPRLYQANEAAADYFHQLLLTSAAAESARKYVQKRGLTEQAIKAFRLGFSLDDWEQLKRHLKGQGFSEAELVTGGLATEKEGRCYDRFRGRLMYPICNIKGQVVGFGARALDDSMPKYLNSAESPIFKKSDIVYALDRAKEAIRSEGRVVIVEGYMDAITAHQYGFLNVVASMGTALTDRQISMIEKLTTHIYLSLDSDAAGNAATLRGIELFRSMLKQETGGVRGWLEGGTQLRGNINILSLPEGKDPDDVIRESPEKWRELVNTAQPLIDYLFTSTAREFNLTRLEGKSQLIEKLLPLIAEMKDSAMREAYLTRLSRLTGVSERVLAGKLADRFYRKEPGKPKRKSPEISHSSRKNTGDQLEEYCLSLLLRHPLLRELANDISADHFECAQNREVFAAWQKTRTSEDLLGALDAELHDHVQNLLDKQTPPLDKSEQEKAFADCFRRLKMRSLKSQYVFEAESALEDGTNLEEGSARLIELQRRHASLS
ncbi:MAG: DNA primase [Dehalococcoidia bacterium]|nr:DNA primase [Dehalococcoidia bacterium]